MACIICPTVTATDPHAYREEMERVQDFAPRLHIDLMDKEFTGIDSINLAQAWWGENKIVDLHIMYQQPLRHLETIIAMCPQLVIIHAEAEGDLPSFASHLNSVGIKSGLALLQATKVDEIADIITVFDHALVFSGHLGHHNGQADLSLLAKVEQLRQLKPGLEISWDGGVDDQVAGTLATGGLDVLNVGGYIQHAENPQDAYEKLQALVEL